MSILVVGSVAFDGIKTPAGKVDRCLGGSATYFSLAASFFADVRVVAVVGDDFTAEDQEIFNKRGVDMSGLQRASGKTFFWRGEYGENMNEAHTLSTDLNVFETFNPKIPASYLETDYLFLGNIDPVLQTNVRKQMSNAQLVAGDTMNYWINGKSAELAESLAGMDILLINDGEARMLGKTNSLPRAAQKILSLGPKVLVIKHGEYGATAFFKEAGMHPFRAPALPIEEVVDPTGAGDCFAGGFMGYIASQTNLNRDVLKKAMFYGGVMGSFAVERFGTERFKDLTNKEIEARFQLFRDLSHLD
ncbi:MAG: sugar kinase, ribokinase family [Acidobacteriales bacterium]|nr:sugar kinase, ribokinase family [Terriglobales bacterium]